jgi:uncharacterized protein (DUF2235 family)
MEHQMSINEFARSRRLIVCCDGTGQKVDHRRSNVARLYDALDRANPAEQVDFYHPGVGTRPTEEALTRITQTLVRWAGSTAGYGLLDVVAKAYGFVVDNYRPGDAIYLIGFSRGALAARLLGGVLHRIGVLRPGAKNMYPYGFELYDKHATLMANISERHRHEDLVREFRTMFCVPGPMCIKFLGIWDTVKAFGVFVPRSFPHLRHNESVQAVCHALALDERRRSFMFTSWGGLRDYAEAGPPLGQTVKEVWFAGVHSDVGGGYPEDESGLSWHSFRWMVGEAIHAGVKFDGKRLKEVLRTPLERASCVGSSFHTFHESRTLGWHMLDLIPRPELHNAPARTQTGVKRTAGMQAERSNLPVPPGWPKHPLTFWPISGHRDVTRYRREGALLLHRSVEEYVKKGRYRLEDVRFVDDAPLDISGSVP